MPLKKPEEIIFKIDCRQNLIEETPFFCFINRVIFDFTKYLYNKSENGGNKFFIYLGEIAS